MRDHHSAVGNFRRDFTEPPSNVFVRQAVKSVAANALCIERFGNGEAVGHVRMAAMEGGVETRDLQHLRLPLQDRFYGSQVVWLMQWSERYETREPVDH